MPEKLIIIINGRGGVGEDTLGNSLRNKYRVMIISAIDPIKEIAHQFGWNGEKDNRARLFLAELKQAFVHYNNLPTKYLVEKTEVFLKSPAEILFVQIREANQIEEYKKNIFPNKCITLLIKRAVVDDQHLFGNHADDDVDSYSYDFIFENDMPIDESCNAFSSFIQNLFL